MIGRKVSNLNDCMERWHAYPDDYFGTAEFAEVMGITSQAMSNQLARGHVVEPICRLKMGPLWTRQQVRTHILNSY